MLLHAREGHVELLGKVRDRSVCTPELLQNAASGGVGERGERGIETGPGILNHVVQYYTRIGGMQGEAERVLRCRPPLTPKSTQFDRLGDPRAPRQAEAGRAPISPRSLRSPPATGPAPRAR